MKKILFFAIFYSLILASTAQNEAIQNFDIPIKNNKILLLGEEHYVKEIHEIERQIVKNIVNKNTNVKCFKLCLERPLSCQYFIENLLEHNDSNSFKQYLQCIGYTKEDSLTGIKEAFYKNVLYYLTLAKSMKGSSLQLICIDNENMLHSTLFTILYILKKYDIQNSLFQKQLNYLDSLYALNDLLYNFADFHACFGNYFFQNKDFFQNTLTQKDFYYISEILNRCLKNVTQNKSVYLQIITEERDLQMYNQINKQYNDSTFYIAILGWGHVLQNLLRVDKYSIQSINSKEAKKNRKKFKNAATFLRTDRDSHFKYHIISIVFQTFYCSSKTINKTQQKMELIASKFLTPRYPGNFQKHKEYLNTLLSEDNISFINLKDTKLKNSKKYADYLVVIKRATGID